MDDNVQNIRSGRALAGFGKFFSGLGLVIAAIGAILGGAVPVIVVGVVLLIIGGSLGSVAVNTAVRKILPQLLNTFQVIHICGKGNLDESLIGTEGYVQYEYVDAPLKHLFAAADVVISRAGANSICELLALRKPNLLIPLSAAASRGDQILNADSFARQGFSKVLKEEDLSDKALSTAVFDLYKNRETYINAMEKSSLSNAVETITSLIESCVSHS